MATSKSTFYMPVAVMRYEVCRGGFETCYHQLSLVIRYCLPSYFMQNNIIMEMFSMMVKFKKFLLVISSSITSTSMPLYFFLLVDRKIDSSFLFYM